MNSRQAQFLDKSLIQPNLRWSLKKSLDLSEKVKIRRVEGGIYGFGGWPSCNPQNQLAGHFEVDKKNQTIFKINRELFT